MEIGKPKRVFRAEPLVNPVPRRRTAKPPVPAPPAPKQEPVRAR
jgi:hypothetical protein